MTVPGVCMIDPTHNTTRTEGHLCLQQLQLTSAKAISGGCIQRILLIRPCHRAGWSVAEAKDPVESHTLRRGNLIINDVREEDSESEGEEGGEEDEMGEGDAEGITEVKWAIPPGFSVAERSRLSCDR